MPYKRSYKRTSRRYKKRSSFRRRKSTVPTSIKRYVSKVVHKNIENKDYSQAMAANQQILAQSTSSHIILNSFTLVPTISMGGNNGMRVGDQITVRKYNLRLFLSNYSMALVGQFVRVVIYSIKDYNADVMGSNLPGLEASNFFRSGTGTATANGTLTNDNLLPINNGRLTVHYEKRFVLGMNIAPMAITTAAENAQSSSPQHKFIQCNLLRGMRKWRYDENGTNANLPTNHNLFCTILTNACDNVTGTGSQVLKCDAVVDVIYEDA